MNMNMNMNANKLDLRSHRPISQFEIEYNKEVSKKGKVVQVSNSNGPMKQRSIHDKHQCFLQGGETCGSKGKWQERY